MFDSMYTFFNTNKLLSNNQSGFRPGDSTINQLLSITTEIFEAFENYQEVRAIFLDISKAFAVTENNTLHDKVILPLLLA